MSRWSDTRLRLLIRAAKITGTTVRAGRALIGVAGAASVAVGLGEVTGHVFGHHLAPWVALLTGGVLLIWIAREINSVPKRPPREPDDL